MSIEHEPQDHIQQVKLLVVRAKLSVALAERTTAQAKPVAAIAWMITALVVGGHVIASMV